MRDETTGLLFNRDVFAENGKTDLESRRKREGGKHVR